MDELKKLTDRALELSGELRSKVDALNREDHAFQMGVDCARNGANSINCHFSIFSTPERIKAWEDGKKHGAEAPGKE